MTYKLTDILHETPDFWVLKVPKGHEVYQTGITHSTRVAQIGNFPDGSSLQRAITECNRRQAIKDQP